MRRAVNDRSKCHLRVKGKNLVCGLFVLVISASSVAIAIPANAFPILHTVTFVENDNASDQVTQIESSTTPEALTQFSNMSPLFSDPGFAFVGWNTSADGTGTSFTDGETYSFASDSGMYAQWIPIPVLHTVTFFENDNGSDTQSSFMTSSQPTQLTLFGSIRPNFQNAGNSFLGWNTSADGSGTSYTDGSQYSFSSDIGLYAQWSIPLESHKVTFDENASTSDIVTASQSESASSSLTLISNQQPAFEKTGYIFTEWNTSADGSGTSYADGAIYAFASDLTLFAQWREETPPQIEIVLNEGGTGSPLVSGLAGSTIVLPTLDDSTNPGFSFEGWNTESNGSGIAYLGGSSFVLASNMTLFAQWTAVASTIFKITLNSNGGSGAVAFLSGAAGAFVTVPSQLGLIRSGFVMTSWNTESSGKGASYPIGSVIAVTKSFTLFAQWNGHQPTSLFGAIGTFPKNSSVLSAVLKSQVERLALTVRSRRYSKVDLFGYTATTGLASLNLSLSRARAKHVASYMRSRFFALRIKGVSISFVGEGAIAGESGSLYSRVEAFGV